jgi:hypothetical protein
MMVPPLNVATAILVMEILVMEILVIVSINVDRK